MESRYNCNPRGGREDEDVMNNNESRSFPFLPFRQSEKRESLDIILFRKLFDCYISLDLAR